MDAGRPRRSIRWADVIREVRAAAGGDRIEIRRLRSGGAYDLHVGGEGWSIAWTPSEAVRIRGDAPLFVSDVLSKLGSEKSGEAPRADAGHLTCSPELEL